MVDRETYPDSVNRVRPPNTTMPKTLAALPRSQYATALELVSGKALFELPPDALGVFATCSAAICLSIELRGDGALT
jgi:hypothetical protein